MLYEVAIWNEDDATILLEPTAVIAKDDNTAIAQAALIADVEADDLKGATVRCRPFG